MLIREYQSSDCKELVELFYNTVHTVNAKDYTKEQLNVWATEQVNLKTWNQSIQEHFSIVAVDDDIIVGFGDIDKSGYLGRLFVHLEYQRKGIATAICNRLESEFKIILLPMLLLPQNLFLKKEDTKLLKNNR